MNRKRRLAILVLIAMFVTLFPVANAEPKEANAANYIISPTYGKITFSGEYRTLFQVGLTENNAIAIVGKYYSNSYATLSYQTAGYWFTKKDTGGKPGLETPREYIPRPTVTSELIGNERTNVWVIPTNEVIRIVETLYGVGYSGEAKLYISSAFVLVSRDSSDDPTWDVQSYMYPTVTEIRDAANWTETTWTNFPEYYDLLLTVNMTKYGITTKVEPAGAGEVQCGADSAYSGKDIKISALAKEEYEFSHWTITGGGSIANSKSASTTFTMPESNVTLTANFVPKATPTPVPKVKFTLRTHYSLGDTEVDVETFNGEITKGGTYAGHQWYSPRTHDVPAYGLTGTKWNWISSSSTGDIEVDGMKALSGPINQDSTVDMYYKVTPTPTPTPKPAPAGKCIVYLNTHYTYNGVEVYVLRNTVEVTKGGTYKGWIWKSPRTSEYDGKKYQFVRSVLTGDVKGDGAMVVYESSPINQNSTVDMYYELNEPTPTPKPTATPKPTKAPIPPRYEKAPQIVVPTAAPVPVPVLPEYSNIHEDECHTGYEHVHNNCYYPVYHSHTSSCYHTHVEKFQSGSCYALLCGTGTKTYSYVDTTWSTSCNGWIEITEWPYGQERCGASVTVYGQKEFINCGCGSTYFHTHTTGSYTCSSCGYSGTNIHPDNAFNKGSCTNKGVYTLICGYYDDGPICGKTESYVEYYGDCGKVEGYYYDGWTVCDPICDQVVTDLTPMYPKQTLQIGDVPNVSAYATFMSSTGKHKDYPVYPVLCSMTGFDASLYNKWQTVTLSYGTYANSAKNKQPTTTTIQVYIAGEVTVSFDANGGTCSTASKTVTYGKSYGTLPVPTREDYAFWGWVYNDAHIKEDSVVATTTDHTLTAAWTPLKQTVTFDANGGTVSPTSKVVTYGKTYGTLPTPTRSGYTFDGWWYGDQKVTDTTIVDAWKDHTLIADWLENTYKITLDANGGSCTLTSVNVKYNQPDNNSIDVQVTRPGYIYKGLWTAKTGGTQVYDINGNSVSGTYWKNGTWSYPGNLTVYVQWEEGTNTIHYAPNGGVGIMDSDNYKVSVITATLRENSFTKTGYKFSGWNTKADGSGTAYGNKATITIPLGVTVLYAQWSPISYTIYVAKDDIRVSPPRFSTSKTLSTEQTFTIPASLGDKAYTVTFDKNANPVMSTANTISLSSTSESASLAFYGWWLYEVMTDGTYRYLDSYNPGDVVKNLTSTEGGRLILFPRWGGTASCITLPDGSCAGYDLVGFTTGHAYPPGQFSTEEAFIDAVANNILILAPNGSGMQYQPKKDETLYAYWQAKTYEITFEWNFDWDEPGIDTNTNWPGETKTVTFDSRYGELPAPTRDGYNFIGWYLTEDETGNGCGEEVAKGTYMTTAGNHTLYAKWEVAFKEAEVWLTSCAVYWRTKAIPEEETLDPEEDVLEIREGGLSPMWIAARVTGRFDYMTIEVPWESSIRTIDFDSAEYDRETDRWELPGFVEYVSYGEPVAFGERVYDPTMHYYEEGDEVLIGFIPHDAGKLSRWFEAMLRKDIVLFALWENERMAEQPGWTDETYEIKVSFYGNDKLLQGYKVGVKFASWDVWNQQILHGRDSATGGWM